MVFNAKVESKGEKSSLTIGVKDRVLLDERATRQGKHSPPVVTTDRGRIVDLGRGEAHALREAALAALVVVIAVDRNPLKMAQPLGPTVLGVVVV